ncbi:YdcF family protein [Aurantiacibacter sediminis]|uniref:YdcF family protein n=1 Tax=Aurantiacibacter sediminis TaxID=2793064 RepID=A0ABS0N117_9SPHN|nr:YdcF family protein [Aurantiacibacter sediminis]MBH5321662.1 YdcF family protein [Aurantiacibacter sediminis]
MIRRIIAIPLIIWALGFVLFVITLPQPVPLAHSDAVVVPTGSGGRIERGLEILQQGGAEQMLVTGVDVAVQPGEFQVQYDVPNRLMDCCVALGFSALDTRGNAVETAEWMQQQGYTSMRLVTADWHMRRAAAELEAQLPSNISITRDAVRSEPSLWTLFLEFHKFIAAWLLMVLG